MKNFEVEGDLKDNGRKTLTAEHFAKALHDSWGVGLKDCQNGVLFFLATEERQVSQVSYNNGIKKCKINVLLLFVYI